MPFSQILFWSVPIVALASYCLLMLFFALSKKDKFILMFMLVLAALIVWTASSLFMKMQLYPGVLFWNRLMVMGLLAVPFLLYCFISVFTNSVYLVGITFWAILTVAAILVDLLGLVVTQAVVITNTVINNGIPFESVEFSYTLGIMAFPIYFFMFLFILVIFFKARKSVRNGTTTPGRFGPITAGIVIMFIGVLSNVIPAVGKYPVDILASFFNAVLIMVAIYKYRLLELRFMLTRGIVFSLLATLITGVYIYFFFFIEQHLTNSYGNIIPYFTALLALLVAILFQPIYGLTNKLVDKMFYKAEYSQRQALRNFSANISNKLNLNDIAKELIDAAQTAIYARQIYIFIRNEEKNYYKLFSSSSKLFRPDIQISFDNPIVKWLINDNACLTKEQLSSLPSFKALWESEKRVFQELDIEVIISIKSRNHLIGILMLTSKQNNTAYTLDDLDLLAYLGSSTAAAFDNARLYDHAQKEALTDSVTKLYNHRFFCKALSEQVGGIGSAELSLLLVDLDMFKLFNDLYGHYEGDNALETVASIMLRIVGQNGIVCRYGGDEFAILLPYYDSKRTFDVAEKIRTDIQQTFFNINDVTQRFLTASMGICTYPHAAPNEVELLKRADLAVYSAKIKGKNQTIIYTPKIVFSGKNGEEGGGILTTEPSYVATIYALTATIDAKDHYTFGHSQRVAEYATILASALSLDKLHLEIIREAALLHDIGKIGIPESILTKNGRLTVEEFDVVKRHVEMSITIMKHLPSLNHVIPAIIGHHERWDGGGYPRGLKGENIPLAARCLSIADSFDAMTSNRPYRPGLSIDSAIKEIEKNIGTQFDPLIARLFISLVRNDAFNLDQGQKMQDDSIHDTLKYSRRFESVVNE